MTSLHYSTKSCNEGQLMASMSAGGLRRGRWRVVLAVAGVACVVFAVGLLGAHSVPLGLCVLTALCVMMVAMRRTSARLFVLLGALAAGVAAIAELIWFANRSETAGSIAAIAALAAGFASICAATRPRPRAEALLLQALFRQSNSFTARSPAIALGDRVISDIAYGTMYPNSFLDIHLADDEHSTSRPTYIVIHGGGWIAGDKSEGDPYAEGDDFPLAAGHMLRAGYNVVTVNYALAPQYQFPVPTIQLGHAVEFLRAHGAQYGISMDRVVIAGGSAGGHIAATYANVQTNPDFARELGIAPTLADSALRAVVLDTSPLEIARTGRTQEPDRFRSWIFGICAESFVDFQNQRLLDEANVIRHVGSRFPPTFISEGNHGTFPDQAADLAARLSNLGVQHRLNMYPRYEARLPHGFMYFTPGYKDDYIRLKIAFLEPLTST